MSKKLYFTTMAVGIHYNDLFFVRVHT